MKKIILTSALLVFGSSFAESVQPNNEVSDSFYLGFHLGPSQVSDISDNVRLDTNNHTLVNPLAFTFSFNTGIDSGVVIGRSFDDYRAEFEISRFSSSTDKITVSDGELRGVVQGGDINDLGRFSGYLFMANILYDFKMSSYTPYAGLGLGLSAMKLESDNKSIDPDLKNPSAESQVAYQVMLGVKQSLGAYTYGGGLKYVGIGENKYVVAASQNESVYFKDSVSILSLTASLTYSF